MKMGDMMKKIRLIIISLIVLIYTSGCVKYNMDMNITKTKKMEINYSFAIKDELLEQSDNALESGFKLPDQEQQDKLARLGFTISEFKKDGYTGIKAVKTIKNIDEISTDKEEVTNNLSLLFEDNAQKIYYFKVKKGFFKNSYNAKFDLNNSLEDLNTDSMMNIPEEENNEETEIDINDDFDSETDFSFDSNLTNESENFDNLMEGFDVSFSVSAPYGFKSHNSNTITNNGKTLTWNLMNGTDTEFEFELYNLGSTITSIVAGVLLLLLFIISIIKNTPKKEKEIEFSQDAIFKEDKNAKEVNMETMEAPSVFDVNNGI